MRPLVLASTAKHRGALLARLGLPFTQAAPDFDESRAPAGASPAEVALAFSAGKARSLAARYADALIIGADQTAEIDGARLTKPLDEAAVAEQLRRLSGRTHALHSGVAVYDAASGRLETDVARVDLTMRALSPDQIRRYVERDRPVGSVGGYLYEGVGVGLFEDVRGSDESAIVGLPLVTLSRLLRRFGVDPLA